MESKKINFFNRLSFIILLVTISLSLFFFIPYVPVTVEASKGFLLSIGATLALFFWLIARLGEGKFTLPKDRLVLGVALIPLVFLISSFFSASIQNSLFGSGFDVDTFSSMLIFFIVFFLASLHFQSERRILYFIVSIFLGSLVFLVLQLFNLFVGFERVLPGVMKGIASGNFVGNINNFTLIIGLITLLSLLTIELLKTKRAFTIFQYFLLIIGLFYLAILNVPLVWLLVGLFSVIIFVYTISIQHAKISFVEEGHYKYRFPFTSLVVIFVALIFLVGNNTLGVLVSRYINVSNPEVRPSITTTSTIAYRALWRNPVTGSGPNTFVMDWSLSQPKAIAQTVFWGVDFPNGYSMLLSLLATTGILGLLAMLFFLFLYVVRGIRLLRVALHSALSNYITMSLLLISVYCWLTVIIYNPNIIILTLAFASTGIIIGALVSRGVVPVKELSFLEDPRNSFFSILGLMILMVSTVLLTYIYVDKFTSIIYFSKSLANDGSMESLGNSEKMLIRAISLNKNDIYYRTLSQVYLNQMNLLINDKSISKETLKTNLQKLINLSQESSGLAVNQNPKQYLNYMNLGYIYSAFVPLEIENSYEMAMSAYNKAGELAPNNPSILLAKASLELAHKNNEEARKYIDQALLLKTNYIDAIFLTAQIDVSEGNLTNAIKKAEYASALSPNDPTVFFKLGILRYNNSDFTGAYGSFEQAVILNPSYMNARFFLGQSYNKAGRKNDALVQFKILKEIYPDSKEIKDAIDSLSYISQPVEKTDEISTTKTKVDPNSKLKENL